ncbi:MAG: hypothetical protein V3S16_12590 [Candidatus Desulfatibia sp.]|uniref:hypothetical protein n=1 Tax=Candidatus Desulfatibia sp. TaxID=3101189 RepID=UPI002F2C5503
MNKTSYFNQCLARHEELLFQELAQASMWKPEYVGIDYIQSKEIQGNTVEEVVDNCIKEMKADGLVKDASYKQGPEGILLKLVVRGCMHMEKEVMLKKNGVKPYCCPITNMIFDRILELLGYEITFLGGNLEVDEETGECVIKCGIWESAEKVGETVSDWKNF